MPIEGTGCSNQYGNKLPHGFYCGGKISTENPCNQKKREDEIKLIKLRKSKKDNLKD